MPKIAQNLIRESGGSTIVCVCMFTGAHRPGQYDDRVTVSSFPSFRHHVLCVPFGAILGLCAGKTGTECERLL